MTEGISKQPLQMTRDDFLVVGFDHPNYAHMVMLPDLVRAALAQDFD